MTSSLIDALDTDLFQRLLAREPRAWRTFMLRYNPVIYAAIDRVLRRFPEFHRQTEREECHALLLSALVARDMQKLRAYDAERGIRFTTWISMLTSNAAWDHVRRLPRRRSSVWDETFHADSDPVESDPLSALLAKEDVTRIAEVLDGLSEKDRQFAELFYLGTSDAEEVADIMQISVKTVYTKNYKLKARLSRALRTRRPSRAQLGLSARAQPSLRPTSML